MAESAGRDITPNPICDVCGSPIWGAVKKGKTYFAHPSNEICLEVQHALKAQRHQMQDRFDAEKRQFFSWLGGRQ